jgi:hypothetical protein
LSISILFYLIYGEQCRDRSTSRGPIDQADAHGAPHIRDVEQNLSHLRADCVVPAER